MYIDDVWCIVRQSSREVDLQLRACSDGWMIEIVENDALGRHVLETAHFTSEQLARKHRELNAHRYRQQWLKRSPRHDHYCRL
jgi:hypothetical protein